MGRRRGAPASSLDLLLDTICNTFGGVVFLAILTIILLQMSGHDAESTSPEVPRQAELADLELRREDAAARLKTLRAATAQQDALREQLVPADVRELAKTLPVRGPVRRTVHGWQTRRRKTRRHGAGGETVRALAANACLRDSDSRVALGPGGGTGTSAWA